MRDYLLDIVSHTHDLGTIDLIKITGDANQTIIDGIASNKTVVVKGTFTVPSAELTGTFGMPNLNNLKTLLNLEAYQEDGNITLTTTTVDGQTVPTGLHFENKDADFKNDYRFMVKDVVDNQLKSVQFKGTTWGVEFNPTVASTQRLKMMASTNNTEVSFQTKLDGDRLMVYSGDHSTHAGEFVFQTGVSGTLNKTLSWPTDVIIKILDLAGDKTMRISDSGIAEITVNSGLIEYSYLIPALSK